MNELFKIIVFVLERLLHDYRPLFTKPKKISLFISDGIRECCLDWNNEKGVKFRE